jgi:hypothetical protein
MRKNLMQRAVWLPRLGKIRAWQRRQMGFVPGEEWKFALPFAIQTPSFRDGPKDQTSDAQLCIGEFRDSPDVQAHV